MTERIRHAGRSHRKVGHDMAMSEWHRKVATSESEDALQKFACSKLFNACAKCWALRERVHAGVVFPRLCRVQTT
jgi:hypothetical protein